MENPIEELSRKEFYHLIECLYKEYTKIVRGSNKFSLADEWSTNFFGANPKKAKDSFWTVLISKDSVKNTFQSTKLVGGKYLYKRYLGFESKDPPETITLRDHHATLYFCMLDCSDKATFLERYPLPSENTTLKDPKLEDDNIPETPTDVNEYSHRGYFYSYIEHKIKLYFINIQYDGNENLYFSISDLHSLLTGVVFSGIGQIDDNTRDCFVTLRSDNGSKNFIQLSVGVAYFKVNPEELLQGTFITLNRQGYFVSARTLIAPKDKNNLIESKSYERYLMLRRHIFRTKNNMPIQKIEDLSYWKKPLEEYEPLIGTFQVLFKQDNQKYLGAKLVIDEDFSIEYIDTTMVRTKKQIGIISIGDKESRYCISLYPKNGSNLIGDLYLDLPERRAENGSLFFKAIYIPFDIIGKNDLKYGVIYTSKGINTIYNQEFTTESLSEFMNNDQYLSQAYDRLKSLTLERESK